MIRMKFFRKRSCFAFPPYNSQDSSWGCQSLVYIFFWRATLSKKIWETYLHHEIGPAPSLRHVLVELHGRGTTSEHT